MNVCIYNVIYIYIYLFFVGVRRTYVCEKAYVF